MAKIKGICKNIDGECPLALDKTIQEADKDDFVCQNPDCGRPLYPVRNTKRKGPQLPIPIIAAILVLCGIGVGAYFLFFNSEEVVSVEQIAVNRSECLLDIGDSTLVTIKVIPSDATDTTVVWTTSNPSVATVYGGLIKANADGAAIITVKSNDGNAEATVSVNVIVKPDSVEKNGTIIGENTSLNEDTLTPKQTPTTKPTPRPNTKPLNGFTFSGNLKNGYPHGHGVLTFKKRRQIDRHDEKARVAEVGDYIQGEWNNGHLLMGHWFGSDHVEKEFINIGGALDTESDHSLYRR